MGKNESIVKIRIKSPVKRKDATLGRSLSPIKIRSGRSGKNAKFEDVYIDINFATTMK